MPVEQIAHDVVAASTGACWHPKNTTGWCVIHDSEWEVRGRVCNSAAYTQSIVVDGIEAAVAWLENTRETK